MRPPSAKEHAARMRVQTASPLRVGFAPDVPTLPFMPLFEELAVRLPSFELTLADASAAGLCEALLHGTLDVAVVTGSATLPDRLNRWTLFTDVVVLLIPPGHELASAVAVPLTAFHGANVICRAQVCEMVDLLEQAQQDHGARPAIRHQADTVARMADLMRAGLGVALSTELTPLPEGLHKQSLATQAAHDVVLVAVAGRPTMRAADAFIKLARARAWRQADLPRTPSTWLPTNLRGSIGREMAG